MIDTDLAHYLNSINSSISTLHGDISTLDGYMSSVDKKLDVVIDYTKSVLSNEPASKAVENVDYTDSINQLMQLLAYTDLLLLVLIVFVVIISGMLLGLAITRWMKARR